MKVYDKIEVNGMICDAELEINLPENVAVGDGAFYNCSSLPHKIIKN